MLNDISPLDWHNVKFLDYIPPHFAKVKFRHVDNRNEVLAWIEKNVAGRFAIASELQLDDEPSNFFSAVSNNTYIAFEDPAEATMYTMFYR